MRATGLVAALLMLAPACADAEWQVRPFIGFTFGGATTLVYLQDTTAQQHPMIGVSGGWIGDVVGVEGDYGRGFGWAGDKTVLLGTVISTLTGNVVIALPRTITGEGLRPYFVGGGGFVHLSLLGNLLAENLSRTLPAMTLGGGVTGFLTNRVGLNWELRRLSTFGGEVSKGTSFGREQLSFWRATMAVAVRY